MRGGGREGRGEGRGGKGYHTTRGKAGETFEEEAERVGKRVADDEGGRRRGSVGGKRG